MRIEVHFAKTDALRSTVVMYRQVSQFLVPTMARFLHHKTRREHSIAIISGDIINPLFSQEQIPCQKPETPISMHDASRNYGPVLVTISRKEMREELALEFCWQNQVKMCQCDHLLSHSSTLSTFR